jgi:hypothetical protein
MKLTNKELSDKIHLILTPGNKLTISCDLIDEIGYAVLNKGDIVTIKNIEHKPEHWSNFFNMFLPEEINGIRLEELDGLYFPSCFEELKEYI